MALHTHYDSLQVKRDASLDAIKGAYRYLSQKWHPDKQPPSNRAEAERITKQLTRAYEVLSDPVARKNYDEWIEEQETRHDEKLLPVKVRNRPLQRCLRIKECRCLNVLPLRSGRVR